MSFPVGSSHAVTASVALDAPSTLRNSRRLTPVFFVSWVMLVVAVGAIVARLLALSGREIRGRGGGGRRRWLRRVAGRVESFLRAVTVHVAADTPAHVQTRELIDAIHVLDLAVTRLAGNAGVDVARVREVHVFRHLVNADPGNGLRFRTHGRADRRHISILL